MKTSLKIFFLLLVCGWTSVYAQKLPIVQKEGVYAPANVKIDGKPTEWNNEFKAYNKSTEVFYTIANDDNNLYLTIQAIEPEVINKIIGGGITLTINKYGNKKDKKGISITYPVTEGDAAPRFLLSGRSVVNLSAKEIETMIAGYNKKLGQSFKWIKLAGVAGQDELISVYNQDGFKVAGLFDKKKHYTYELSVPLKYLEVLIGEVSKFTYHLMINGRKQNIIMFEVLPGQQAPPIVAKMNEKMAQMAVPTDFWGEYTLAKN